MQDNNGVICILDYKEISVILSDNGQTYQIVVQSFIENGLEQISSEDKNEWGEGVSLSVNKIMRKLCNSY